MVYRIRYRDERTSGEAEAVVEAATPTEALVKFCHTRDDAPDPTVLRGRVTSISPDSAFDPAGDARP
jgi:hypothetical protein